MNFSGHHQPVSSIIPDPAEHHELFIFYPEFMMDPLYLRIYFWKKSKKFKRTASW